MYARGRVWKEERWTGQEDIQEEEAIAPGAASDMVAGRLGPQIWGLVASLGQAQQVADSGGSTPGSVHLAPFLPAPRGSGSGHT